MALVADQAVIAEPSRLNPNSLWGAMLGMFTLDANRGQKSKESQEEDDVDKEARGKRRKKPRDKQ